MAFDQQPSATTLVSFPSSVPDSSKPGPPSGVPSISEHWVCGRAYRPFCPCIDSLCLQNIVAPALRLGTRCNRGFLCWDEAYPDWSSAIFRYFAVARLGDPITTTADDASCLRSRGTQSTLVHAELVGSSRSYP